MLTIFLVVYLAFFCYFYVRKRFTGCRLSQYIVSLLVGYVIGSFPTAYLLVKWKSRVDIRSEGTGNVGAMNTFDVTGSTLLGFSVFFLDVIKGISAAEIGGLIYHNEFWMMGVSGIGAIVGHNYPVWLKFEGGRGLAPAVGVSLVTGWIVVPVWCLMWLVHYLTSKNIHIANIMASLLTPLFLIVCPERFLSFVLPATTRAGDFIVLISLLLLLIVVRHFEFIVDLLKSIRNKIRE